MRVRRSVRHWATSPSASCVAKASNPQQSAMGTLMKVMFATDVRLKRIAKQLKKCAGGIGIELKLSAAQNAMARVYGYCNYHDFRSQIGVGTPTLWDDAVGVEEVRKREAFQTAALAEALQIEKAVAARLVAEIAPTGSRRSNQVDAAPFRAFGNSQSALPVVIVRRQSKLPRRGVDRQRVFDLTRS